MCFNLIQQLLTIDPSKRPTIEDALMHPYWSEEPKACEKHEYFVLNLTLEYLRFKEIGMNLKVNFDEKVVLDPKFCPAWFLHSSLVIPHCLFRN
jgi:hypothetical protein